MCTFMQSIIDCIERRFGNFSEDQVLLAFDIFDPANLPEQQKDLGSYGNKEIKLLCKHFDKLLQNQKCQTDKILKEWLALKLDIFRHHKNSTIQDLWAKIFSTPAKVIQYANVLHLVEIMLVTPVATAQIERQFSFIKRFLGDWRLGLSTDTLEALLRICIDCSIQNPVLHIGKKNVRDVQPLGCSVSVDCVGHWIWD